MRFEGQRDEYNKAWCSTFKGCVDFRLKILQVGIMWIQKFIATEQLCTIPGVCTMHTYLAVRVTEKRGTPRPLNAMS